MSIRKTNRKCEVCSNEFLSSRLTVCNDCVPHDDKSACTRWYRYGITHVKYLHLLASQEFLCAICKENPPTQVDHRKIVGFLSKDDRTLSRLERSQTIRGLLCMDCNTKLSSLENKDWFIKAKLYIKNFPQ